MKGAAILLKELINYTVEREKISHTLTRGHSEEEERIRCSLVLTVLEWKKERRQKLDFGKTYSVVAKMVIPEVMNLYHWC